MPVTVKHERVGDQCGAEHIVTEGIRNHDSFNLFQERGGMELLT